MSKELRLVCTSSLENWWFSFVFNWLYSIHFLYSYFNFLNHLSANPTKWSNTLKQFVGNSECVFDHFVGLALQGLQNWMNIQFVTQKYTYLDVGIKKIFSANLMLKLFKESLFHLKTRYFTNLWGIIVYMGQILILTFMGLHGCKSTWNGIFL